MRLLTDILREYRRGKLVDHSTRLLNELVRAVDETGKGGELTITIKIKPSKEGGSEKVITAGVKMKRPEPEMPEAIFYSDKSGDLHRSDPAQVDMPFEEVGRPRSVAAVAG